MASVLKRLCSAIWRFCDDLRSQFSSDPLDRCRWVRFPSTLNSVSDKPKDDLARAGEEEAVRMLRDKGYVILQRNVRFPGGELDIVARQGRTLVFVEVKTRRRGENGLPLEAVTEVKQRRQILAVARFQSVCRVRDVPARFDVVSILWPENQVPTVEHWENAYRVGDQNYR